MREIFRVEFRPEAHREDVVESGELSLNLVETRLTGDEQQEATGRAIAHRYTHDGFEIERPAREEAGDMRHHARMISYAQFEHGGSAAGRGAISEGCGEG